VASLRSLATFFPVSVSNAVAEDHQLLRRGKVYFRILDFEAGNVDAAFGDFQFQNFEHLFELKIRLRGYGHRRVLELIACLRAFEVEAQPKRSQSLQFA